MLPLPLLPLSLLSLPHSLSTSPPPTLSSPPCVLGVGIKTVQDGFKSIAFIFFFPRVFSLTTRQSVNQVSEKKIILFRFLTHSLVVVSSLDCLILYLLPYWLVDVILSLLFICLFSFSSLRVQCCVRLWLLFFFCFLLVSLSLYLLDYWLVRVFCSLLIICPFSFSSLPISVVLGCGCFFVFFRFLYFCLGAEIWLSNLSITFSNFNFLCALFLVPVSFAMVSFVSPP